MDNIESNSRDIKYMRERILRLEFDNNALAFGIMEWKDLYLREKQKSDDAKKDQERYQFLRAQGYYDTEDENDIGKFEIFQMTDLMCAEAWTKRLTKRLQNKKAQYET